MHFTAIRAAAPAVTPETEPFWQAAAEGRLLLAKCRSCAKTHYYPRTLCPYCFGETEWIASSGKGTVYSYSIMRKAAQPYAIAYVTLDEGPTIMTNIVDCAHDEIRIGCRVSVVFKPTDGPHPLPMFTPCAE